MQPSELKLQIKLLNTELEHVRGEIKRLKSYVSYQQIREYRKRLKRLGILKKKCLQDLQMSNQIPIFKA